MTSYSSEGLDELLNLASPFVSEDNARVQDDAHARVPITAAPTAEYGPDTKTTLLASAADEVIEEGPDREKQCTPQHNGSIRSRRRS